MYIEPRDPSPDSTFANTRIYELLTGLCKTVEDQMARIKIGRPRHTRERNFYEVTFTDSKQLARIYRQQQEGSIPITLWTRIGEGPLRRYTPDKPDLKKLLRSGIVTKGALPPERKK
jgi:hypothetical protein